MRFAVCKTRSPTRSWTVEQHVPRGTSIVSVMVAIALSSIVAVVVGRMMTNQAQALKLLELQDQRGRLLRHYSTAMRAGLLATALASCGSGNFCGADGSLLIPGSGLYLNDNLYDYGNTDGSGRWWKIHAERSPSSKYAGTPAVELTVEFRPEQHPTAKMRIKPSKEVVFMPLVP